jgi:hypothetical protein
MSAWEMSPLLSASNKLKKLNHLCLSVAISFLFSIVFLLLSAQGKDKERRSVGGNVAGQGRFQKEGSE